VIAATGTIHPIVEQEGFAIVADVFSQRELRVLLLELAKLPHGRAGIRHLMSMPVVATIANDKRVLKIAEEALSAAAIPFRATLFDKSPFANWKVMWHQDTALPLRARSNRDGWGPWSVKEGVDYAHAPTHALQKVVALRLNLDASTHANGPLRVMPGTHKLGVLSDEEVERISANQSGVNCIAEAGSVVVMRPLIFHASSKSTSDEPRRVLHVEYASTMNVDEGMRLTIA
jgi:ectoine hydroxylase-related dioxygenase (phytanoyl-CoA dioxygenase family)